jgi:cytoskeletal protein CcmA (bactofilin family)
MRLKFLALVSVLTLFLIGNIAFALDIRTGQKIEISSDDILKNNTYIIGENVVLSASTTADVVIIANQVQILGEIKGDVFVIANKFVQSGVIHGDIRGAVVEFESRGAVFGDTAIISNRATFSDQSVNKEILLLVNRLDLYSSVDYFYKFYAREVNIFGLINSSGEITAERVSFLSGSKLNSSMSYYSPNRAYVDSGSNISGSLNYNQIESLNQSNLAKRFWLTIINFFVILKFVANLILVFFFVYVFRVLSVSVIKESNNLWWKNLLKGALVLMATPIIILIAFISLLAAPMGVIILLLFLILLVIMTPLASIYTGQLIFSSFHKQNDKEISFLSSVIGLLVITFISFVPYLGIIIEWMLIMIVVGGIFSVFIKGLSKLIFLRNG